MNIRSTSNNLNKMLAYLETLSHKFDIIGLSDTWLKKSEADLYDIPGYDHVVMPRVYAEHPPKCCYFAAVGGLVCLADPRGYASWSLDSW